MSNLYSFKAYSIGCFKCISINGQNNECDDPFHNNYSTAILESPCMGGRKNRDGLFPATSCIKISGYYYGNNLSFFIPKSFLFNLIYFFTDDDGQTITITVRGCALDSGSLTTDTEIVRMSHCGKFYYEHK